MTALIVILVILGVPVIWIIFIYNKMVALRFRYKNAFAQIDVQLKRRYDLIPNLVESVKAYIKHERETLEAVIAARNQARSAADRAAADPGDPAAIRDLSGAEGVLTGALGRLFAVMENYPNLKASENISQLTEELTSTENRVAFARQAFNDSVMTYNTYVQSFPPVALAGMFNFQEAQLLEFETEEHREAPKVSF
ncbi:MAG: LemA family protein [Thermodesulfobacteriota bacterium]